GAIPAIAVAQVWAGTLEAAMATVARIPNQLRWTEALAAIARAQARAGGIPGSLESARGIDSDVWLAAARAEDELRFSESGVDDRWYYEALVEIAAIRAGSGDISGAMETARAIDDVSGRSRAMVKIARVQ